MRPRALSLPAQVVDEDGRPLACSQLHLEGHLSGPALWMKARQLYQQPGVCRLSPPQDGVLTDLRWSGGSRSTRRRSEGPTRLEFRMDRAAPLEIEWVELVAAEGRRRRLVLPLKAASYSVRLRLDEPLEEVFTSLECRRTSCGRGEELELSGAGPGELRLEMTVQKERSCAFEAGDVLLLALAPPREADPVARDLVFCLGPGVREDYPSVAACLEALPERDRFGIVALTAAGLLSLQENWLEPAQAGPQAGLWLRAAAELERKGPQADLVTAAEECLRLFTEMDRVQHLVMVLSEPPSSEEGAALEAMMATALGPRVVVVTPRPDPIVRRLAAVSRGRVLWGPQRFERLPGVLAEPVATDPVLLGEGIEPPPELIFPERLPDLHRGRLSWALARRAGKGSARIHALKGNSVWEEALAHFSSENPALPALGTWLALRQALDRRAVEPEVEPSPELEEQTVRRGLLTGLTEWDGPEVLRLEAPARAELPSPGRQDTAFQALVPQLLNYCRAGRLRLMVEMGRPLVRLEGEQQVQLLALPWGVYRLLIGYLRARLEEGSAELYGCLPDEAALQVCLERDGLVFAAELIRLEHSREQLRLELEKRLSRMERHLETLSAETELRNCAELRHATPKARPEALVDSPRQQERMAGWLENYRRLEAELKRTAALLEWGSRFMQDLPAWDLPVVERFRPGWDLRIEHWLSTLRAWCSSS